MLQLEIKSQFQSKIALIIQVRMRAMCHHFASAVGQLCYKLGVVDFKLIKKHYSRHLKVLKC